MKATTNVWIAIRNIGDAQDAGQNFNGTLSESILWMAKHLSSISMAGRIVVGFGRTQADALRGIDVKHAGKSAVTDDMKAMLDSVFVNASEDANGAAAGSGSQILDNSAPRIPGDTYVA